MKYQKPEVVPLGRAVTAIQGQEKSEGPEDRMTHEPPFSIPAYEADE